MSPLDLSLCRQDKWGRRSECYSPCVIPAPESALGSHPCGALSSAQVTSAYNRKTQSPFSPECVNHVPGTKCKRCPGLDTSSPGLLDCVANGQSCTMSLLHRRGAGRVPFSANILRAVLVPAVFNFPRNPLSFRTGKTRRRIVSNLLRARSAERIQPRGCLTALLRLYSRRQRFPQRGRTRPALCNSALGDRHGAVSSALGSAAVSIHGPRRRTGNPTSPGSRR